MAGYRGGGSAQAGRGLNGDEPGRENAAPQPPQANLEPWYNLAREAAQIVVSSLALYASIRAFMEKMRKRRGMRRREEA